MGQLKYLGFLVGEEDQMQKQGLFLEWIDYYGLHGVDTWQHYFDYFKYLWTMNLESYEEIVSATPEAASPKLNVTVALWN